MARQQSAILLTHRNIYRNEPKNVFFSINGLPRASSGLKFMANTYPAVRGGEVLTDTHMRGSKGSIRLGLKDFDDRLPCRFPKVRNMMRAISFCGSGTMSVDEVLHALGANP